MSTDASVWTEHRSQDGRLYWYNTQNQQSVWDKPEVLQTPSEKALSKTQWKEYETNGRKYYVHSETKETTWDIPQEVKDALESVPPPVLPTPPPSLPAYDQFSMPSTRSDGFSRSAPAFVPAGTSTALVTLGQAGPLAARAGLPSIPTSATVPIPEFATHEEAERAFIGLLRSKGVTPSWTWEQVMRDFITEPIFKSIRSMSDRRAAFEKFLEETKQRERETREKNLARLRPAWREGLGRASEGESGMKDWWGWEKSKRELSTYMPDMWKMAHNDEERKILWEEYVGELRKKEEAREREARSRNLEKLDEIFRQLSLDLGAGWSEARRMVERSSQWTSDAELQQVDMVDVLEAFETYIKAAEREANDVKQRQKEEKRRRVRKTREAFVSLLHELKLAGEIKAGTKWSKIYRLVESDDRYQNMLGNPGSSPIDLFWDVVDELDQKVEEDAKKVELLLTDKVTENMSWESFKASVRDSMLAEEELREVYAMLHDRAARAAAEERRRNEKRMKAQMDDLCYALKRVEPAIELDTTYEAALPGMSQLKEFNELKDEDGRRKTFEKYLQRLKDRVREKDMSDDGSAYSGRRHHPDDRKRRRASEDYDRRDDRENRRREEDRRREDHRRRDDHREGRDHRDRREDERRGDRRPPKREREYDDHHRRDKRRDSDRTGYSGRTGKRSKGEDEMEEGEI